MHTFNVAVTIGPCTEFFHQPGGQSRRRIRQAVGKRLWFCALDLLVTGFHFDPSCEIVEIGPLLWRRVCWHRQIAPHYQKVQMDADQRARMRNTQAGSGKRAIVATLGPETPVSQDITHQVMQTVGDLLDAETGLSRPERQTEAGQRRCDDREGVAWVTVEPGRIGEAWDDLQKFEDTTGPSVHEQQWHRVWSLSRSVNEMQVDTVQRHFELLKRVQFRLLRAPVKSVA